MVNSLNDGGMSNINTFRALLLLSLGLNWIWFFTPWLSFFYSDQVRGLLDFDGYEGLSMVLQPSLILAWHVARTIVLVGLFFLRRIAFFLFIAVLAIDLLLMTFGGVFIVAPFQQALYTLLYLIDGAILVQSCHLFLKNEVRNSERSVKR